MECLGIIPARYQSSRFPGKPLVEIKGKPMIQRTWEQVKKALENVVVATDDERIKKAVDDFGGMAVMTSSGHQSGTERCGEAADIFSSNTGKKYDIIINIQGDEPFIQPEQIRLLADCFNEGKVDIATLVKKIDSADDIFNPNFPKAIFNKYGYAIYFSRSPLPFVRGKEEKDWIQSHDFYRHIGMYAYRPDILHKITRLEPTPLELAESLEQNRWIENGYSIKIKETTLDTIGIDIPEDIEKMK